MKNVQFKIIMILALSLGACTSEVSITEQFDNNLPFAMNLSNKFTIQIEIQSGMEKHIQLVRWLEKNSSGWKPSTASYNTDISLTQNDFRLLYSSNGLVVIGFMDRSGDSKQFTKTTNESELDFLLDN